MPSKNLPRSKLGISSIFIDFSMLYFPVLIYRLLLYEFSAFYPAIARHKKSADVAISAFWMSA